MPGVIDPGHLAQANFTDHLRPKVQGGQGVLAIGVVEDGPGGGGSHRASELWLILVK